MLTYDTSSIEGEHVVNKLIKLFEKKTEMDQFQNEIRSYLDAKKNEDEIRLPLLRKSDRE